MKMVAFLSAFSHTNDAMVLYCYKHKPHNDFKQTSPLKGSVLKLLKTDKSRSIAPRLFL